MMLLVSAPSAHIALVEASDSAACAAPEELRAEVIMRLGGRDPFDDAAERRVELRWTRGHDKVSARIDVIERDGRRGQRILSDRRCDALVASVALAIAIAVDPRAAFGPIAPPEPARTRRPAAVAEVRRGDLEPTPFAAPRPPINAQRWWLDVASGAELGATPGVALSLALRIELGTTWRLAAELGLRGGLPVGSPTRVTALGGVARVEGCRAGVARVCAGLVVTRTTYSGDAGRDATRDMLGASASVGVQLHRHLRAEVGAVIPLTRRLSFTRGDAEVWRAWLVQPALRVLVTL